MFGFRAVSEDRDLAFCPRSLTVPTACLQRAGSFVHRRAIPHTLRRPVVAGRPRRAPSAGAPDLPAPDLPQRPCAAALSTSTADVSAWTTAPMIAS